MLSPATATIAPGGTQAYTAQGLDAYGNARGDVTAATAGEASQPAPVGLTIIPDPGNPGTIDISAPGTVTWTGSAFNAANPAEPPPADGTYTWTCETVSFNPCPEVEALLSPNSPSITFTENMFNIDTYILAVTFSWTDPNYQSSGAVATSVEFSTTNSGGDS